MLASGVGERGHPPAPGGERVRRNEKLREWIWPASAGRAWPHGAGETWFELPRYFPALLRLLSSKALRGDRDLSRTYLSLFALHEGGVVELGEEGRHAELAGFTASPRGIKSWRERMRLLEALGFLRIAPRATRPYGFVLLLDPLPVVEALWNDGRLDTGDWTFFRGELLRRTTPRKAGEPSRVWRWPRRQREALQDWYGGPPTRWARDTRCEATIIPRRSRLDFRGFTAQNGQRWSAFGRATIGVQHLKGGA